MPPRRDVGNFRENGWLVHERGSDSNQHVERPNGKLLARVFRLPQTTPLDIPDEKSELFCIYMVVCDTVLALESTRLNSISFADSYHPEAEATTVCEATEVEHRVDSVQ